MGSAGAVDSTPPPGGDGYVVMYFKSVASKAPSAVPTPGQHKTTHRKPAAAKRTTHQHMSSKVGNVNVNVDVDVNIKIA